MHTNLMITLPLLGLAIAGTAAVHSQPPTAGGGLKVMRPGAVARAKDINDNFEMLRVRLAATAAELAALRSEAIRDLVYVDRNGVRLPASKIVINGCLHSAKDLEFSFNNGTSDNGLDVGQPRSNQWYALYAVPDSKDPEAYMLKGSVQLPAPHGSGPQGFAKHRYLGVLRSGSDTAGGAHLLRFTQVGPRFLLHGDAVSGGTAGGYVLAESKHYIVEYALKVGMDGDALPFDRTEYRLWGYDNVMGSTGASLEFLDTHRKNRYQLVTLGSGVSRRPEVHVWQVLNSASVSTVRLYSEEERLRDVRWIGLGGWVDPILSGGR